MLRALLLNLIFSSGGPHGRLPNRGLRQPSGEGCKNPSAAGSWVQIPGLQHSETEGLKQPTLFRADYPAKPSNLKKSFLIRHVIRNVITVVELQGSCVQIGDCSRRSTIPDHSIRQSFMTRKKFHLTDEINSWREPDRDDAGSVFSLLYKVENIGKIIFWFCHSALLRMLLFFYLRQGLKTFHVWACLSSDWSFL